MPPNKAISITTTITTSRKKVEKEVVILTLSSEAGFGGHWLLRFRISHFCCGADWQSSRVRKRVYTALFLTLLLY